MIAINRHPVFPKFIKIVEVTNLDLVKILRRKVKLNQPYAGVFVKRDDENSDEVVNDLNKLHPVGSFVQVNYVVIVSVKQSKSAVPNLFIDWAKFLSKKALRAKKGT